MLSIWTSLKCVVWFRVNPKQKHLQLYYNSAENTKREEHNSLLFPKCFLLFVLGVLTHSIIMIHGNQ